MENKVAIINAVPYGSTGRITSGIANVLNDNGYDSLLIYGWTKSRNKDKDIAFKGWFISKAMHMTLSKISGLDGCFSFIDTARLIHFLKLNNPKLINLHVVHSWGFNIPMLMKYIKKNSIPVIWTFHDCWAFTGHCPNFTSIHCEKWKTGCYNCPLYKEYPGTVFDNSGFMWKLKKRWFTGVSKMVIANPSKWMESNVQKSIFKAYPTRVFPNGIDLNVFHPTNSNFREEYKCESKIVVLGVALGWSEKKGLDTFIWLSKKLPDRYKIVLVGTNDNIDKILPENIVSIHRTESVRELAEIYTAADVFVNPTLEDNLPTVNIEALACGTPIISYRTGGSPETFDDTCGTVIEYGDRYGLLKELEKHGTKTAEMSDLCVKYAERFEIKKSFYRYYELINSVLQNN